MSAEDRLRDLLRAEATTIVPAGDGLERIRERIARRRRARFWLLPSAAVATAAAAGAFFLLAPDDRQTATLTPGVTPSSSATDQPSVSPTPLPAVPDDGGMPLDVPAIWPFTTQAQAAQWSNGYSYAQNGLEVGRHFVHDFLGLKDVEVSQKCVSCGVLELDLAGKPVGEITLARVGVGFASGHGTQVYTVVGVGGTDLTVTSPRAGAAITSPTSVTGRINGVHENVQLRLLSQAGDELANAGAPAGMEVPWSATLTWSRSDWSAGGIVGVTRSDKDGSVTRVVAVPVTRSTSAPTSSFAGIVDGHVSLFDASSGKRLRQLTYPGSGKADTQATWSAGTLAWVRTSGASACVYELDRLDGGKASTVASSTSVRYGSPQLSPSAALLAWAETPCSGGGGGQVVVSGGGAPARHLQVPSGSTAEVLDVTDDGALLVVTNDAHPSGPGTIGVVPAGATSLSGIKALQVASGCSLASGAAFDGTNPVAFESCGTDIRFVRFTSSGARSSTGPASSNEPPSSVSVRDGQVLAWLFGGDNVGSIATYKSGTFTTVIANNSCASNSDLKGCVSSPDW
jgi:hypothetical protein